VNKKTHILSKWLHAQSVPELLIYLTVWILAYLTPVIAMLSEAHFIPSGYITWNEVVRAWVMITEFLVIFLIHNFFIAPLLVQQHRTGIYLTLAVCLLGCYAGLRFTNHPGHLPPPPPITEEGRMVPEPGPGFPRQVPPSQDIPPKRLGNVGTIELNDVIDILLMISLIGANLGMKYYFLMRRERLLLEAREKENLRQQLENLRYQISPHLFMNTLNNIHALVDINPEEAKQSIVTLSRIMRFMLYDGAKNYVHLANSVVLLRLYTDIMRMRYSDKVKLQFSAPDDIPSSYMIPPLLIIPLLGNAYKHGVSYKKESFVNFTLEITPKQRLNVTCVNSNHDSADGEHGGVGLTNLRKRLNLIFGHDYSFTVSSTDAVYESVLNIPIHIENQTPESS